MKNYLIGSLLAIIIAEASYIYKLEKMPQVRQKFQISKNETKRVRNDVTLFLYMFFSKHNCQDCLQVIEVLNKLPSQFIVTGIVPDNELSNEEILRGLTGATFPLVYRSKYNKNIPWYSPTIIGVLENGDILFQISGVPGLKTYLENFLDAIYSKIYPIIFERKNKKICLLKTR